MSHEIRRLLERAREATGTLRDAAREGRVIDFHQRDPLVMAIHKALDRLEALLASYTPPTEIECPTCAALIPLPAVPSPADPQPEGEYWRGYAAGLKDTTGAGVLQAVLDAISGKLDPSTQIADHPNVKFAQMERRKLLASQRPPTEERQDTDGD